MAECTLYNMEGKEVGQVALTKEKWGVEPNVHVMHAGLLRQLANGRAGTRDTKTRGEVSGGGRKPWKQKGTGRARSGSIRSPLWKKGGVVFGPHPRDFSFALPRKVRRLALQSALALKIQDKKIVVVDVLKLEQPKTKRMEAILTSLKLEDTTLIVIAGKDENLIRSARNIPGVKLILANNLNLHDLLCHEYLLASKDAVAIIEEVFLQ